MTENAVEIIAVTETNTARSSYLPILGLKRQWEVGITKAFLGKGFPNTWTTEEPGGWLSDEHWMCMLLGWAAALGPGRHTVGGTIRNREQTGGRQEGYLPLLALKSLLRHQVCREQPCITEPIPVSLEQRGQFTNYSGSSCLLPSYKVNSHTPSPLPRKKRRHKVQWHLYSHRGTESHNRVLGNTDDMSNPVEAPFKHFVSINLLPSEVLAH